MKIFALLVLALLLVGQAGAISKTSLTELNLTQNMPAALKMGGYKVTGMGAGTAYGDATNLGQSWGKVNKTGDTMTGALVVLNGTAAGNPPRFSQLMAVTGKSVVYGQGSDFYGIASNGSLVYSGANLSQAVNTVAATLPTGRKVRADLRLLATGTLTGKLMVPNYTTLDATGSTLTVGVNVSDGWNCFTGILQNSRGFTGMHDLTKTTATNKDIEIKGGRWINAASNENMFALNSIDGLYWHDMIVEQATSARKGMVVIRSMNVIVERVNFTNMWIMNIADGAKYVDVRDCDFTNNYDSPISMGTGADLGTYQTRNITVSDCDLNGCTEGYGLDFYGDVKGFGAYRNRVSNMYGSGILITMDGASRAMPKQGKIIGNVANNNGLGTAGSGINVYGKSGNDAALVISQNTANYNNFSGISVGAASNMTITDNVCNANANEGIFIDAEGGITTGIIASGNQCHDYGGRQDYGIHLYGTVSYAFDDVVLTGNSVGGNVVAGISVAGTKPTTYIVENNVGFVTRNFGLVYLADGGTITHGLAGIPTCIMVMTGTAGQNAYCTGADATTATIAIKTYAGAGGTTQNCQWLAMYKP